MAMNARRAATRRRRHEKQAGFVRSRPLAEDVFDRKMQSLLDEEVERLPELYRTPFILCCLEAKPSAQAACELNIKEATVWSRVARARKLLRKAFASRGVVLSAVLGSIALAEHGALAVVPRALVGSTVRAATATNASAALSEGLISSKVATLVRRTNQAMTLAKWKTNLVLLLGLATMGIGLGTATHLPAAVQTTPALNPHIREATGQALPAAVPTEPQRTPVQPVPAQREQGRLEGRFTAAGSGKPVAGAKVKVLTQGLKNRIADAQSGSDGRYVLDVPLGSCNLWGVSPPPGYYIQDPKTYGAFVTSAAKPTVVRDFVLQPGAPWRAELHGVAVPLRQPPYFSAVPHPESEHWNSAEIITVTGDARGVAVLTIPAAGGRYRFTCGTGSPATGYEIPSANLEIDAEFDPRQVKNRAEPLVERRAVRLRDAADRAAVVEGADVVVDNGQVVVRFHAQLLAATSALAFSGTVLDEGGKPIVGAKIIPAFASRQGAAVWSLETTSDADGTFRIRDVRLPQAFFETEHRVSLLITKRGYDGVQTKEIGLLEIKKDPTGDFGNVILKPGHVLHGKVVDENGEPAHGAVVTNMTNYFLYGDLQCRTDAKGLFAMPDLSFGNQKIAAGYGERSGQEDFKFDATGKECLITVRPIPKSGTRISAPAPPRPAVYRRAPTAEQDGTWDLAPPIKEPKYQSEPRYALLVFGPKRDQRVWMVLDGKTLYVDRKGNGDLTEPGKRLEPNNPKDGSNRFSGSGSHTHFDIFEFTVDAGIGGSSTFRLDHWIRAEGFIPKTEFDKKWDAKWRELHWENATLWRKEGRGQGQTPVLFMPKPADAQVCALDGPLTFVQKLPEYQILQRGEGGCDLAFHIAVLGRPHRGAQQQFFNRLATKEVPEGAHLEVEIEYPGKTSTAAPLRRKYLLKERC
jgi:hypothetical protein